MATLLRVLLSVWEMPVNFTVRESGHSVYTTVGIRSPGQWRSQALKSGWVQGMWVTEVPQRVQGQSLGGSLG